MSAASQPSAPEEKVTKASYESVDFGTFLRRLLNEVEKQRTRLDQGLR